MADSIDNLARRWRARPDAAATVALCESLRLSSPTAHAALVDEVGKAAAERHATSGPVLLAVARLYAAADRLGDAQATLVSAGRASPRDATVFRMLGEVLLRRGDAERAEKVLDRAMKLGARDTETAMWMDRARLFGPVQAKGGMRKVAAELAKATAQPIRPRPGDLGPPRPPADTIDEEDLVTRIEELPPSSVEPQTAPTRGAFGPPTETTVPRGVLSFPRDIPIDAPLEVPDSIVRRAGGHARPPPPPLPPVPDSLEDTAEVALPTSAIAARPAPRPNMPTSREVLAALRNAGVFEPREVGAGSVEWNRPKGKISRKSVVGLSVGLGVFVLASAMTLVQVHRQRVAAHKQSEAILAKVEAFLDTSEAWLLPEVEQTIGHAFELDSRSPRAASDWLEERTLKGLLQGGADLAFEDAIARAVEVKVPDEKIAFARVSAFLFQGDTGGAAGLLPRLDGLAAGEPLYQLVAGTTLDHAGDPHAAERYQAAVRLAPTLVLADVLLARTTAIAGDPAKAADLAEQFRSSHLDRPEGLALVSLAWAKSPPPREPAPPEVAQTIARASELPLPLSAVPYALQAIAAIDKHSLSDAKTAIDKGLGVADDPGMATWLGTIALETRDAPLVRRAALAAVRFSAVYPPARVLAGRVALLDGRLDEALKAIDDLDASSPDVAVVRAAAAYERVDAGAMERALAAAANGAKPQPALAALRVAADVLLKGAGSVGSATDASARLLQLGRSDAPWGDLVAMDAALDLGLTEVADTIRADWSGTPDRPLQALRLSRLSRYEGRLDDADRYSKLALDSATVTPRILVERVLALVALNRATEVEPLLAGYPLVSGPVSSWLSVYALATSGKLDEARRRTTQLDVPEGGAPLPFREVAAIALASVKDRKRAEPVIKDLVEAGCRDRDVLAAAAAIGVRTGVPAPTAQTKK
jgi:predicted Zn-dependent protease